MIMATSPITLWQIDEKKKMEIVTDFIFLGSKITVDSDCSHEIKRCLLLGRRAMINLESVFKSRDITLPTKVHLVKVMVFPESCVAGPLNLFFWTVRVEISITSDMQMTPPLWQKGKRN